MIDLQSLTDVMNSEPDAEFTINVEILSYAGISVSNLADNTSRKWRKARRLVEDGQSMLLLVEDDYTFSAKANS